MLTMTHDERVPLRLACRPVCSAYICLLLYYLCIASSFVQSSATLGDGNWEVVRTTMLTVISVPRQEHNDDGTASVCCMFRVAL